MKQSDKLLLILIEHIAEDLEKRYQNVSDDMFEQTVEECEAEINEAIIQAFKSIRM